MEKHGVRLVPRTDPGYPTSLAEIYDPPCFLYIRGELTPADVNAVAVVGSRSCTDYGKRTAARLAGELARAGYTVVSGLARGIDASAHRGALAAGGRTLAVLAGGLSRIYPPEHRGLADEVEQHGAVLTESSMRQESLPALFPARNRVISGLCKAVVVVEADEKSGALITAEHAAEQGRTVLAVPGPADSPQSAGTNALIRQGAVLCRGGADVLEELCGLAAHTGAGGRADPVPPPAPAVPTGPPPGLDEPQRASVGGTGRRATSLRRAGAEAGFERVAVIGHAADDGAETRRPPTARQPLRTRLRRAVPPSFSNCAGRCGGLGPRMVECRVGWHRSGGAP